MDSGNKQTLLFKETIFEWFCVSLGGRKLLPLLAVGCIDIARFWDSWPLLGPRAFFVICKVSPCVSGLKWEWSSKLPKNCCWLFWTLSSIIPTAGVLFCCWLAVVGWYSAVTDLHCRIKLKVFRICGVVYKEQYDRENKKIIIKKISIMWHSQRYIYGKELLLVL